MDMSGKDSTGVHGTMNLTTNVRTSPMGQSSSQGQGSSSQGQGSGSSQLSSGSVQLSPASVSFQTFGKSSSNQSLDKSPTTPNAIGPASKYPDFGSRPSSAKNKSAGTISKGNDDELYTYSLRKLQSGEGLNKSSEMLDRNAGQSKSPYGTMNLNLGMPFPINRSELRGPPMNTSIDESESAINEVQASIFDYRNSPSEASSRSVTPPLPPLSNTDSEPSTPELNPKFLRAGTSLDSHKTPDVVTSARGSLGDKRGKKLTNSQYSLKSDRQYGSREKIPQGSKMQQISNGRLKRESVTGTLSDVRESGAESDLPFDIEDTILTVDSIDTEMQNMHDGLQTMHDKMQPEHMDSMKERLSNLEGLYQEVLRIVGSERDSAKTSGVTTRRRWSLGSSDTSSLQRPNRKFKVGMTANQRHHHHHQKDIK